MSTQRFAIALIIILLFAAVLGYMLQIGHAGTDIMIGALVAAFALAPKWYFDSSPGSDRKTELLAQTGPVITAPPATDSAPPTPKRASEFNPVEPPKR